jgi:hypothetical protein
MIIKTRQPKPKPKPKPKTLKRVTYSCTGTCLWHDPLRKKTAEHKRFTVRGGYKPDPKRPGWAVRVWAVWDKQRDDWLYPNLKWPAFPGKHYRTRDEAKAYLKNTTEADREYKREIERQRLEDVESALDGEDTA